MSPIRGGGGRIEAVPVSDPWLVTGINDRAQLSAAARELNARIVRRWQLAGVTVQDPSTTWIDLDATLAEDVEILPGTQIKGATAIERGATIGPDTTLVDCEIGENAVVKRTDATLAVIGAGASVGPFAYLRPGSYLGAGGKIGTFVEVKNSRIGAGTSATSATPRSANSRTWALAPSSPTTTGSTSTRRPSGRTCARARTTCSSLPLELVMEPTREPARWSARTFPPARWPSVWLRSET